VACIQEAPRFLRWRSKCAALARRSGLVVVGGGRPAAANLVLSSLAVDVVSTRDVLFSKDPGLHRRGTSVAILRLGGVSFAVAGIHLDLAEPARLHHVGELRRTLDEQVPAGVPVVVAGDVNDVPGSACWQALTELGTDAYAAAGTGDGLTFSATNPQRRIDAVFVPPQLRVISAEVLDSPDVAVASDHRPLMVELDL
jgi:endonuclease/exonuclease/phosphatase family metal-dependent hydrolase